MRRIIALVSIALVAVFVGVVGVPPVPAHATMCTNSLTCNPANAPILTELGIITTSTGSVVAPAAPAAVGAAAGVNWSAVWTAGAGIVFGGVATVLGINYMASNGWGDQTLTVDPDFDPGPGVTKCTSHAAAIGNQVSVTPGVWSGQPTCNVASSTARPLPYVNPATFVTGPMWYLDDYVYAVGSSTTKSKVTFDYTRVGGRSDGPSWAASGPPVTGRCYSATGSPQAGGISINLPAAGDTPGTRTVECPLAGAAHVVLWANWYGYTDTPTATPTGAGSGVLYDSTFGSKIREDGVIDGEVRSRVECMKPDGTSHELFKTESFIVVGDDPVPVPDVRCPNGEMAVSGDVSWRPTGTLDWLDLIEADVPPAVREWQTEYPDCFGPSAVECAVALDRKNASGDWENCGSIGQYCEDWASTDPTTLTERYRCRFGHKTVDIVTCSMYRKPSVGVLPNVKTDGTPIPVDAPAPTAPINPKTDQQLVDLGLGGLIDTKGSGECWPTGWGVLNPLSWVYMPIQCAVTWATQPRLSVVTSQLTALRTAWIETPPGQLAVAVGGWSFVPPGSGCAGISVSMDWFPVDVPDLRLFDACAGSIFAPYAGWAKLLISLGFIVGAVMSIRSSVAGVVDYNG